MREEDVKKQDRVCFAPTVLSGLTWVTSRHPLIVPCELLGRTGRFDSE